MPVHSTAMRVPSLDLTNEREVLTLCANEVVASIKAQQRIRASRSIGEWMLPKLALSEEPQTLNPRKKGEPSSQRYLLADRLLGISCLLRFCYCTTMAAHLFSTYLRS